MAEKISIQDFLLKTGHLPVIDVRSPAEFRQGHIPGAFNIPMFDNEERAVVGTIYHHSGREASVLKGMELAGPKMAGFVKQLHKITPGKEILVHCWRGGLRSTNMAWLFDQAGYHSHVLEGGYKAYRRYIRGEFSRKKNLVVLTGHTGSGKSEILQYMQKRGERVIDLENIAHHKGSVFGSSVENSQPTHEQFENDLYAQWQKTDPVTPVWIEDESRSIGNVNIPDPVYEQMSKAKAVKIEIPRETRVRRLAGEYSRIPKEELKASILKIREKMGGDRAKEAAMAVDESDFNRAIDLVLDYYDKTYSFASARKNNVILATLSFTGFDPDHIGRQLLDLKKKISDEK
jgi:tRNA 2-selenouridine synthase